MTKNGVVRRWDAAKGFGFIRSRDVSADVFFHIKAFRSNAGLVPQEGMAVRFEEVHMGGKGPRATQVEPLVDEKPEHNGYPKAKPQATGAKTGKPLALTPISTHRQQQKPKTATPRRNPAQRVAANAPASRLPTFLLILAVWSGLLVFGLTSQRLSFWALPALAVLNVVTLFAYAFDKNAAERGWWRTAENTLHLFALAGGWPAAWLAQQVLRHKTSKQSFQSGYWATAVLHCIALGVWVFWLHENLPLPLN